MGPEAIAVPSATNVCAVIVTFHPSESLELLIERVVPQVRSLFIVDNNSGPNDVLWLQSLCDKYNSCLLQNQTNEGIARAFNQGIELACNTGGIEWILLFDQDTLPYPTLLQSLANVYGAYSERSKIGIIGSNYVESTGATVTRLATQESSRPWIECLYVISSGSLIPLSVIRSVGNFRENFFIDYVDYDFCFRLHKHSYQVLACRDVAMIHSVGHKSAHSLFGTTVYTSNHSPQRRYYMTRNHAILIKEQIWARPKWAFYSVCSRANAVLLMCMFETERWLKLRFTLRGLLDGIRSNYRYSPLSTPPKSL